VLFGGECKVFKIALPEEQENNRFLESVIMNLATLAVKPKS